MFIDHKLKRIKNFDCIQLYEKRIKNLTIMQKTHHPIYILEPFARKINFFLKINSKVEFKKLKISH